MKVLRILLIGLVFFGGVSFSGESGFTQEDRERLIRLEATLKTFMEQTNERFRELRQDMNKRFEQVDKRISELREDMNTRFEQIDKRFEQVNKMIEQLYTFLWILAGIFTTLTAVVIGFAYWDRRTIIRKAREETIEHLEREGVLRKLLQALREKAKTDKDLEAVLRKHGLLVILIGLLLLFAGFGFSESLTG